MGSYTYLPFDAHHLLMKIGQEKLENLAIMKTRSRRLIENDEVAFLKDKAEVKDLLENVKKEIFK